MNDGDFLMSRSLLDLLLLHLTEDATPEQRRALAHEVMVLAGLA